MKQLFLLILFFVASIAAAGLEDFRGILEVSPAQFEATVSLGDLYPNGVDIFEKGYRLQWEADNVSAFTADSNQISSILMDGILNVYGGSCGGLVMPDGVTDVIYKGSVIVAVTPEKYYFYDVNICAMYNEAERIGYMADISGYNLCEVAVGVRYVRDTISGALVYADDVSANSLVMGVYGNENGCYFAGRDGIISQYDYATGAMREAGHISEAVYGMGNSETGFYGFSKDRSFAVDISEYGGIEVIHKSLPDSGYCMMTGRSGDVYCESEKFKSFSNAAIDAEELVLTNDYIYAKTEQKLSAYKNSDGWVRKFVPRSFEPSGCTVDTSLYYTDVLGALWQVDFVEDTQPIAVEGFPLICNFKDVTYSDGGFYSSDDRLIYRYAEFVQSATLPTGERSLYKRQESERVIYFNVSD